MDLIGLLSKDYIAFPIIILILVVVFKTINNIVSSRNSKIESKSMRSKINEEINSFEFKRLKMEDKIKELRMEERDLTLDVDKISKMLTQLEVQRNKIVEENNNLIIKYADEIEKIKKDFREDSLKQLDINKKIKSQYDLLIMKKLDAKKDQIRVIEKNKNVIQAGEKARKTINIINKRYLVLKNRDTLSNIKSIENSYNYYNNDNLDERITKIIQYQMELVENGDAFDISDYEILNENEFDKSRRLLLTSVNTLRMINYEFGIILNNVNDKNLEQMVNRTNNLFDRIEGDLSFSSVVFVKINDVFKQSKIDELNIVHKVNLDID